MADHKISELTNYTPPIDTDLLPVVDVTSGDNKKLTIGNLASYLAGKAQTLLNKTLTSPILTTPVINVGSDAAADIYYRSAGNAFTRLPIGSSYQVLKVVSGLPAWSGGDVSAKIRLSADSAALSDGVITKLNLNTEDYDTASAYNTSTYKFVAPVAGRYAISISAYFYTDIVDGKVYDVYIYKNGASVARGRLHSGSTQPMIVDKYTEEHLAANDEIEFYVMQASGGGTVKIYASSEVTFATVALMHAD